MRTLSGIRWAEAIDERVSPFRTTTHTALGSPSGHGTGETSAGGVAAGELAGAVVGTAWAANGEGAGVGASEGGVDDTGAILAPSQAASKAATTTIPTSQDR